MSDEHIDDEQIERMINNTLTAKAVVDMAHETDPIPVFQALGLVPPSPESMKLAKAESDLRMALTTPILGEVLRLSRIISKVMYQFILKDDDEKSSPEVEQAIVEQNANVLKVGLLVALGLFLENDVLHYSERLWKSERVLGS